MKLSTLEKHARAGTLEVEHLLAAARTPSPALAELLEALRVELAWTSAIDGHVLPLGGWATAVATYCRTGYPGLAGLARDPALAPFVAGLLEAFTTGPALAALLNAFADCMAAPENDLVTALRVAGAVNTMLSFKPAAPVTPDQAGQLRAFLRRLYVHVADDAQRGAVLVALRGVGDAADADFSASIVLGGAWTGVPQTVARHIRKRLRTAS